MKNLKFKIIAAIVIIIIAAAGIFVAQKYIYGPKVKGQKEVDVTIYDQVNGKTLMYDKEYHTNATTLDGFLTENKKELKAEIVDTKYGPFLNGLMGLNTTSMDKGPWWMYSFESKSENKDYKVGAAPGIKDVNLGKESNVKFVFMGSSN